MKHVLFRVNTLAVYFSTLLLGGCAAAPTGPSRLNDTPVLGLMYSNTIGVMYEGSLKPLDEVAIISLDDILHFVAIDGSKKPIIRRFGTTGFYSTGANQYHFVPGLYKIDFCFIISSQTSYASCKEPLPVTLELQAGQKIYLTHAFRPSRTWGVNSRPLTNDEFAPMLADFQKYVLKQ